MAVILCPNGHQYDADLYGSCPYCRNYNQTSNFQNRAVPVNAGAAYRGEEFIDPSQFEMVNAAPAGNVGDAVAPDYSSEQETEASKIVAAFREQQQQGNIAGWLVCVKGINKGKAYELHTGINTIGRSNENDVYISGDRAISRSHARIAYDLRYNCCRLVPGDSKNCSYLNDQPVYEPANLKVYDMIEMGESKFVFIPLCSERFSWMSYED